MSSRCSSDERRQPLEILARLAGRTTFVLRGDPTGAVPITPLDVAHAVASSSNRLGAAMGMAIACQRPAEWPTVHALGLPELLRMLHGQRAIPGIIAGAKRFRARLALREAFDRMLAPNLRHRPIREVARAWRCDVRACRYLLKAATSLLEDAANTAAAHACTFLFALHVAPYSEQRDPRQSQPQRRAARVVEPPRADDAIAYLLAEIEAGGTARRDGVMTLR